MKSTHYLGLGVFAGWEFTLTPHAHPRTEAPGYLRHTITQCTVIREGLIRAAERADAIPAPEFAKELRKEAECPSEDWVEAQWLTEWLRLRLIKRIERT